MRCLTASSERRATAAWSTVGGGGHSAHSAHRNWSMIDRNNLGEDRGSGHCLGMTTLLAAPKRGTTSAAFPGRCSATHRQQHRWWKCFLLQRVVASPPWVLLIWPSAFLGLEHPPQRPLGLCSDHPQHTARCPAFVLAAPTPPQAVHGRHGGAAHRPLRGPVQRAGPRPGLCFGAARTALRVCGNSLHSSLRLAAFHRRRVSEVWWRRGHGAEMLHPAGDLLGFGWLLAVRPFVPYSFGLEPECHLFPKFPELCAPIGTVERAKA